MSLNNNSTLQGVAVAGATVSTVLALLTMKYNDRPLFYEHPEGIPYKKGFPILGNLTSLLGNLSRIHDFQAELFTDLDTLTM